MPDLGHEIRFGAFLTPSAADHAEVVRLASVADEIGIDLIGVQDHPYQPSFLDTWTLLSHLAAHTHRATLFPDVLNLPLRPPAVLARSAASLDILSGGRLELGIGAGAFWDAIVAMGGQRRSPGEAVDALAEAIAVLRALWTPGRGGRLEGRFYSLHGARPGPVPVHPIGIWIGAYKPKMLRLTARLGDGWLPSSAYAPPDELASMTRLLDAAAADAGRDPAQIRRIYNVWGRFTSLGSDEFLVGPPKQWAAQLTELAVEQGVSGFVLAVDGAGAERDLRTFAEEVAPLVRAEVDGTRGRATDPQPAPEPAPAQRIELWSDDPLGEAGRPRVTKPDEDSTSDRRSTGHRLVLIHGNLRNELRQIREAVASVAAGQRTAASARSLINDLTVRQNFWTLGSFCAAYCRILTMHHSIEDAAMFPALVERMPALAPVVEQLEREHEVIARVLTDLDAALVALMNDDGRVDEVREVVDLLDRVLTSHLDYEEEQLVDPLDRLELDV
jgi:alkanesulfonate monooxygenase SsuD/methylene tetrahydromethanopterin reductase-like flavin-dependent oxidoreductase (luciferase family)